MKELAWRWRWPDVDGELLVSQAVARVFNDHRQHGWGVERGGQLFVNPLNPKGLLLDVATSPHHADRSGRSWLELNASRCTEEIQCANSQGLRLVGYWHTHAQNIPAISSQDLASFFKFARRYAAELPRPIAVIVGISDKPEGIKAWSFNDRRCIEANWVAA